MITSMHIENYKCFKHFDIELDPFNVLIGMNDTGKTAFLEAIRILAALPPTEPIAAHKLSAELGLRIGPEYVWRQKDVEILVKAEAGERSDGHIQNGQSFEVKSSEKCKKFQSSIVGHIRDENRKRLEPGWEQECFDMYIGQADYYRFDPKALRAPSLVASESMTETGEGLPTLLAKLSMADRSAFGKIEESFCQRFPQYNAISITPATLGDKDAFALSFKTVHESEFAADAVSDGVILSLAFIALAHSPNPPSILLIEEPENGVHYASLKIIVETLKQLSEKGTVQIILTTHSPYLLDQVEPEEVRVFTKGGDGAVNAVKLLEYPDVSDLTKHFMTGEIWTLTEADIVTGEGNSK